MSIPLREAALVDLLPVKCCDRNTVEAKQECRPQRVNPAMLYLNWRVPFVEP